MSEHKIYKMPFANVYPHYLAKAERKGRTKAEVDQIIRWLTGYDTDALTNLLEAAVTMEDFFTQAPTLHPNRTQIKGVICGIRVEDMEPSVMKEIRYLDKLIDELAKGKTLEKILRSS